MDPAGSQTADNGPLLDNWFISAIKLCDTVDLPLCLPQVVRPVWGDLPVWV